MKDEVKILGITIDGNTKKMDSLKIEEVEKMKKPTTKKELKVF